MIYYISLLLIIFLLYFILREYSNGKKIFVICTATLIILFQGFRSFTVGIDLGNYIPDYSTIGKMPFFELKYHNFEPGYVLFNRILYILGFNERQFLIIVACIIQIPIFYTLYKNSDNILLSILWYFGFGQFLFTFSGLRQSIAMAICFLAFMYIKKHSFLKFSLLVLFASLFHKSALLCIVIYPLFHVDIVDYKLPLTLLILGLVFIFKVPLFKLATKLVGIDYDITYTGAYKMLLFYVLLYILSFLVDSDNKYYKGFQNILFLECCIYIFGALHTSISRVGYPFELYLTLFIPLIHQGVNDSLDDMCFHKVCTYSFLVLYFISILGWLNTLPFTFG